MTRAPCCVEEREREREGLKKGPWTPDEDQRLVAYIGKHGHGSWRSLPVNAGLQRCGKSCRLRWTNYLRPDIKRGRFSQEEDQMIVHLHAILGNRWSAIASHLPRRTDNEIKNYWNTHLKKRLLQMGIDPVTHKSTAREELVLDSIIPGLRPVVSSNLTHMSQWDCARAEAEARLSLSRQTSLSSISSDFQSFRQPFSTNPVKTSNQDAVVCTNFMSTWKAQVAETLRSSFGVVELDKTPPNPVNLQTFLQDWESSLQGPQRTKRSSTYDLAIDVPDLSSGTTSEVPSPQISHLAGSSRGAILPTSSQITEKLLAAQCDFFPPRVSNTNPIFPSDSVQGSSFNFSGMSNNDVGKYQNFSPTSTLHAPDYDSSSYTNSPCVSSSNMSCATEASTYDVLNQAGFNSLMFPGQGDPAGASFWSRQQVAMMDALQPEAVPGYYNVVPNNIPIPQFPSLC